MNFLFTLVIEMFGTKTDIIAYREATDSQQCDSCNTGNHFTFILEQKYLVFFGIPFFPLRKRILSECKFCQTKSEIQVVENGLLNEKFAELYNTPYPKLKYFIGLILFDLILFAVIYFFVLK